MWPPRGDVFKTKSRALPAATAHAGGSEDLTHDVFVTTSNTGQSPTYTLSITILTANTSNPPAQERPGSTEMALSKPKQGASMRHTGGAWLANPLVTLLLSSSVGANT